MALMSAVATLLAALFVCLGMAPEPREHYESAAVATVAVADTPTRHGPVYICPYDSQHCGVFPHLSPAVLTVPPPATPVAAEPQYFAPPAVADPARGAGALLRAPGRHVLQVMRT
ncbi:hypothetical protein [Streptomyces sp. ISL-100]|uniref:hypothetical protein n=1 Tax=Streptomyces sp. ISL-100 TaxID=2819173 RepID=UPI002034E0BD|nr:hypothetical protein [Streptomyces sp. ISL-100]